MNYLLNNSLTPLARRKSFDLIEKAVSNIKLKGHKVIFVGISGGQASGTTKISKYFNSRIERSQIIEELSFYKNDKKERKLQEGDEYLITDINNNYSQKRRKYLIDICFPDSFDYDKFYLTLKKLSEGQKTKIEYFDEEKCEFIPEKDIIIDPVQTPLIIVEGYYIFKDQRVKEMLNLKIYKDVEDDVRLSRLILREEKYLNKDKNAYKIFFDIYAKYFKISFKENIYPYKSGANIQLPDYKIQNENNEIEEDETLEFLIRNLTYFTKRKN